jgi:RNA polymerase-binding transcription factor DksA
VDPPTPEQVQVLRRRLLKKGAEINEKLTALLANQTVDLDSLLGRGKPGETPIERLRRFLGLVDGAIQSIRRGSYGRCITCGDGLPFVDLEQVPWIDTCRACARQAEG